MNEQNHDLNEPSPNPSHLPLISGTGNRWKRRINGAKIVLQNWAIQAQVALEIQDKRAAIYANVE